MKPMTISIGIPAYNEARNLPLLMKSLFKQKEDGYILKEIIVISDGSSDKTASVMKAWRDKRVIFKDDRKRMGKSARLNQLLKTFTADSLFLIDGDVTIKDNYLFAKIIKTISLKKVGLVGVNAMPLTPKTSVERILEAGVVIMKTIAKKWNNGNNYLSFKGCFLALDKKLARSITMSSSVVNNDAYLYFAAVDKGYIPAYIKDLNVFYRSPMTLNDHVKQSSRYQTSRQELEKYFSIDWDTHYTIPKKIIALSVGQTIIKSPVFTFAYLVVNLYSKLKKQTNVKSAWSIARSTK